VEQKIEIKKNEEKKKEINLKNEEKTNMKTKSWY